MHQAKQALILNIDFETIINEEKEILNLSHELQALVKDEHSNSELE